MSRFVFFGAVFCLGMLGACGLEKPVPENLVSGVHNAAAGTGLVPATPYPGLLLARALNESGVNASEFQFAATLMSPRLALTSGRPLLKDSNVVWPQFSYDSPYLGFSEQQQAQVATQNYRATGATPDLSFTELHTYKTNLLNDVGVLCLGEAFNLGD